jgi:hypothetical protein
LAVASPLTPAPMMQTRFSSIISLSTIVVHPIGEGSERLTFGCGPECRLIA